MTVLHIIEDDPRIAEETDLVFSELGYEVRCWTTGRKALEACQACDVRVLDRRLPDMEGLDLITRFEAAGHGAPTIVLSSLGSLRDRLDGLRGGADDYLPKPFAVAELVARVEALRRRSGERQHILAIGPLTLDRLDRKARRGARALDLLPREYDILQYLMQHEGQVVTRSMLLKDVWNYTFEPNSNVVDVHMSRLKRKVQLESERALIHVVRSKGYRLVAKN